MRVGFFSPMPPAPTGVADYSAALLKELHKLGEVVVDAEACDVALYHIGNNRLHRDIHARALAHPGVVVLHDAVLTHFYLGELDEPAFLREFVYNYGDAQLARELWRDRARSAADPRYFAYPMLKRIVESALTVIVHNPAAAEVAQRHRAKQVVEIPHLYCHPMEAPAPRPSGPLRVGVLGHLRESKRVLPILRVMDRLWADGIDLRVVLQGAFGSGDLERAVAPWLGHSRVERHEFLSEPEFLDLARSLDVCLNLRYPTACETSGIAITLMGLGKAVVFTDGPEISRYPEGTCLRVPAGPEEEPALHRLLSALDANLCAEIGRRAARHIHENHAPAACAEAYWRILRIVHLGGSQ